MNANTVRTQGYDIAYHRDFSAYMLYLPAGTAEDGAPLTRAMPLLRHEAELFLVGRTHALKLALEARGITLPLPPSERESWLRRISRRLLRWANALLLR